MRIFRPLIPAAVAVIAVGALLTACDDNNDDETKADTLTEAEFVDQGNALCVTQEQAVGEVIGPLFDTGQPSPDDQQTALDQVVTLTRGLANDIDALAEPSSLTEGVDTLVTELDAGTDEAATQTGEEFFSSDDDPWAQAGTTALDLGLDACAPEE